MPTAVFLDKLGHSEPIAVAPGQRITAVLRAAGIPVNAVITRVNGAIVAEQSTVVGPDDSIEFLQVRHYDMSVTRNPQRRLYGASKPVYLRTVMFDRDGDLEARSEELDEAMYIRSVEETFVQGLLSRDLVAADDHVVIGLSGGRDSVAFLKLLERTRDRLPRLEMTAVTITGLPDWDEPATFRAATEACDALGIEQVIVTAAEIEDVFSLRVPFAEAMSRIVAGERGAATMVIGHQVLRRMLEVAADRANADSIAFGFNADDLVASLVTWFTSGYRMGGIPVRELGGRRYIFPLYRITKKELTLYLELMAPEWSQQGAPGRFTTGPSERSMSYAIADHLYDLWPGIDYYLFAAFENVQRYAFPLVEGTCGVCGGTYLLQEGVDNPVERCDVCDLLMSEDLSPVSP